MKTICLIFLLALIGCSNNNTPSSLPESSENKTTPKQMGIQKAMKDIEDGEMKVLYYGKPWSQGKPLVDDESGLPIKIASGCCVTPDFVEETNAYNDTMRNKIKENANQQVEPTPTTPVDSVNTNSGAAHP